MKIKTFLFLLIALLAGQANGAEFTGGKITFISPDGEVPINLPAQGFAVADYTSYGQAPTLVVESFEATVSGIITNASLKATMYKKDESAQEWMVFPLTDTGNGLWKVTINQDLTQTIESAGEYVLELYVEGNDGQGNQLLLNNGGQNYKIMFALKTSDSDNDVKWLTNRAAEIYLYTGENYLQYSYNGDGTRNNETMPGNVDLLAVNFFSMYYDLAEDIDITSASLQYMIYPDNESEGQWQTIECNELNTLVSARTNTHKSTFNESRLITRDLPPGNYVLRIMYQLIDNNGKYHFLGKNNDNFIFYFSINEPRDPAILGISMAVTLTPGEQQYAWLEAEEPFEDVDLTEEEPLQSLTVDEVFVFVEGNFSSLNLSYKLNDTNGNTLYGNFIPTQLDDFGNWSSDEQTELLNSSLLNNGSVYDLYFWAEGEGEANGQMYYLNNDGQNYRVRFTFGDSSGFIAGDVDGNGMIDVEDVNAAINIILKLKSASDYPGSCDMDGNSIIDVEDVNAMINIILKIV